MKLVLKLIFIIFLITSVVSCKKYLDVTPDNIATIDYAFRNRNEAENYLFTCYSTLQRGGMANIAQNPGFTTSGEVIYPKIYNDVGFDIIRGTQNTISPALNYWDGTNGGVPLFMAIRRCNIFLEKVNEPVDLSDSEKRRWIAEVKFLKAYYHFWLARMYGPIPIIKQNLPIASSTDEVRVKREPVDSVFNYIVQLLDEAAVDLPVQISNEISELGRITKSIALSVKAEVLVTQASPLFNGNTVYANFKNKDGQLLFSSTEDPHKWKNAADACKAAIDACAAEGKTLYTFIVPANVAHASDSTRLLLTLQNAVTDKWNSEIIWTNNTLFPHQASCMARLNTAAFSNESIRSTFAVSMGHAELFYTHNGVPLSEDKTWDYLDRYNLQTAEASDRYYIRQGYSTVKMHFNREPRFYANVGFDGGIWFGNGTLNDNNALYIQAKNKQPAGIRSQYTTNETGYFVKKLVHYQSVYLGSANPMNYPWPMMRLAGLYLLYAESLNEVNGPSEEVYQYIDAVRERAGLKGVIESWNTYSKNPAKPSTKQGMREIIHQERRIELSFEGHSGWDLRRWKELQDVLSRPIQGWDIYQQDAATYYRVRNILDPVFHTKDYFWPIMDNDLTVNSNLVQNPFW